MRRGAMRHRKALLSVFGPKGRFEVSKPNALFVFLRPFVKACNDLEVWEGKAMHLLGDCLDGDTAERFATTLPISRGPFPGRPVASYL